jgi:excisionase family DNA binding protein
MSADPEDLITVREAARLCRRNPETVRRWIWAGKLPAQKLGNQLFVKRGDLAHVEQSQSEDEEKAARKTARLAALNALIAVGERIGGNIDVVEMLERHRESHP